MIIITQALPRKKDIGRLSFSETKAAESFGRTFVIGLRSLHTLLKTTCYDVSDYMQVLIIQNVRFRK